MTPLKALSFLSLAISALVSSTPLAPTARTTTDAAAIPCLSHIFTGKILIGHVLTPIPIPGGVREIEPFIGGNITGPTLNAVIQGGLAFPTLEENGTVQNVNIALYGVTTDGYSFYASGTGVGSSGNQFAEFDVEVAGPLAGLADEFILVNIVPNESKTVVTIEGWKVGCLS